MRRVVALVLFAAVLVGAARGAAANRSETATCTSPEVRALVVGSVRAFNAGDFARLDRIFASDDEGFQWYSTSGPGQRVREEAYRRHTLIRYFRRRHAQHEQLRLRSFRRNGGGNFEYGLVRSADDVPPPGRYHGKGAALCAPIAADVIIVWSMGAE